MGLPELLRRLIRRREPAPLAASSEPRDPSGILATGEGQHVLVESGEPFTITARPGPGRSLTWRSSDTSVARLEVALDTRSATIHPRGVGRALVSVSDRETCQTLVVAVEPKRRPESDPIGLSIRAGVGMGSPG